jgi:hypothetical protein
MQLIIPLLFIHAFMAWARSNFPKQIWHNESFKTHILYSESCCTECVPFAHLRMSFYSFSVFLKICKKVTEINEFHESMKITQRVIPEDSLLVEFNSQSEASV